MKTAGPARALGHAADRLGPGEAPVQDLDLRLRGRLRRRLLDPRRRPVGDQGRGRATGRASTRRPRTSSRDWARTARAGSRSTGPRAAPRCPGSTSSPWCASHPRPASKTSVLLREHSSLLQDIHHESHTLEAGPRHRSGAPRHPVWTSLQAAAAVAAVAAGRRRRYRGGGGRRRRIQPGRPRRGGSPSFSQPRSPSSARAARQPLIVNSVATSNRSQSGNQAEGGSRSQYGNTSGAGNRNQNPTPPTPGPPPAGYANRTRSNAGAAAAR